MRKAYGEGTDMIDRLQTGWALVWAIWHIHIALPVRHWYFSHGSDAGYFARLGWLAGLAAGIWMTAWGML